MVQKSSLALLIVLLLAAALVRFPYADLGTFEYEKVRDIVVAERLADGPIFHGILSTDSEDAVEQSVGPLFYYLLYFSLSLTSSPYFYPLMPSYLAMVVSLISLLLCFVFCSTFFGRRVAFIASMLYAFAPWVVLKVSNVSTNPNYLSPFILLAFIAYYKVVMDRTDTYLLLFFASIALQFHFHLSALLMIPVYATLFYFRPDLLRDKKTYMLAALSLLVFLPFLIHLATTSTDVFSFLGDRYPSTYLINARDALGIPPMYTTAYLGSYLLGESQLFETSFFHLLHLFAVGLVALFFVAAVVFLISLCLKKNSQRPLYLPLLLWLTLPPLFAFLSKTNISPHYLLTLLPVQFIILGIFFDHLIRHVRWKRVVFVTLSFIILYHFLFIVHFYQTIDKQGTTGLFGIPYKHKVDVASQLPTLAGEPFVLNYYKKPLKVMTYLLHQQGYTPEVRVLDTLDDFSEGVLLLDTYSFYTPLVDGLTPEEIVTLATYRHTSLRAYDAYTLSP